jgi:hypothetical protein
MNSGVYFQRISNARVHSAEKLAMATLLFARTNDDA